MRGVADGGGIQIGGEEKILLSHGYDEVFSFFCRHRGHSITMLTRRGGRGYWKVHAWSHDIGWGSCKMSTIVHSKVKSF